MKSEKRRNEMAAPKGGKQAGVGFVEATKRSAREGGEDPGISREAPRRGAREGETEMGRGRGGSGGTKADGLPKDEGGEEDGRGRQETVAKTVKSFSCFVAGLAAPFGC